MKYQQTPEMNQNTHNQLNSYLMEFNGHTDSRYYNFPQQFHVSKNPLISD